MRKIMLVIDDYNELRTFESLLRRVGFDVLSIAKEILVNDALMKFHADIVLATAKGRSVDGFRLATRLSKLPTPPRVALIFSSGSATKSSTASLDAIVDAVIETPLQPTLLLKVLAQLGGLDSDWILAKYEKLKALHPELAAAEFVRGQAPVKKDSAGNAATVRTERSDRYDKFLSNVDDVVDRVLPRDLSQAAMKQLKEASAPERAALEKLDKQKRAFVDALFEPSDSDSESKK